MPLVVALRAAVAADAFCVGRSRFVDGQSALATRGRHNIPDQQMFDGKINFQNKIET
jgi:hypothetical protein